MSKSIDVSLRSINVGFDAKRLFNNFTGLGNYSRTLVYNLATYYPDNSYFLYTPKVKDRDETSYFLNSPMYNVHLPPSKIGKSQWRSKGVKKDLLKHNIDLYHGLSHEIPLGLEKTNIKSIVTIHDLIFKHYPEQYALIDRKIYDWKFRHACEQADHIIAISESTKQDIIRFYEIPPEKITVVYQSCDELFMQEKTPKTLEGIRVKYQLPAEYLLYVGSIIERKNLLNVLKAMTQLDADIPLVVIGKGKNEYAKKVKKYIVQNGLTSKIFFPKIAYQDLAGIYQMASIFLYPSVCEGFGIPVLEAQYSKTPVITSNRSSLVEAGGDSAYLVNPRKSEEIAMAISSILQDNTLRNQMITKGLEHAQTFDGERVTNQLMEVYERVLEGDR